MSSMNFFTSTLSFFTNFIVIQYIMISELSHLQVVIIIVIMKISERQQFSIKCECIVTKNDVQINGKKKSKFSSISLNYQKKLLVVQPFGSQKDEELLHFGIGKLKAIHKKYIEQGKLTLQFLQKTERITLKGIDVANTDELRQISSQILISSASKQNLQLLITKIVAIKSPHHDSKTIKQPEPKQHIKKKPSELIQIQQNKSGILNRRELMKKAMLGDRLKLITVEKKNKHMIGFFELPCGIIDSIFQYCTLSLSMRVICKRFSQYVLKNISFIKLKEDVDEKTFNKLSKWAIQVCCRMKNVKNIELSDKYEQQQLLKNRAKTLRFGGWKEISSKNIMQMKGLRIYCLQIPYHIKFDLSNLFGLRMVELRLKSSQIVNNRCEYVKTEDLLHLLKTIKDLKVLELPFASSDLLSSIQHPKKIKEIKIYYLNDNSKEQNWKDLTKFETMTIFSLWHVEKLGIKKQNHEMELLFPSQLKALQIGQFLSQGGLEKLPLSLQYLKLLGQNYFNQHIQRIYLPKLKLLDITMSRNIRQDILEYIQDISLATFWDRNTIDFVSNYAKSKQIRLSTNNPGFK